MCTVEEGNELEGVITVGEHRRRLSAELGNGALALDLSPGWSERTFGWTGALGHGALLARRMLPPKAQRGPEDGVELQQEEQGQDQAHGSTKLGARATHHDPGWVWCCNCNAAGGRLVPSLVAQGRRGG